MKTAVVVFAFALSSGALADTGTKSVPLARDVIMSGSGNTSGIGRGATPKKNKASVPFLGISNPKDSVTR
jgi:hypothetical protein